MRTVIAIAAAALLAATSAQAQSAAAQTAWKLVWSDEFNGTAGTPPNPTNWNYDLGGGGWGNDEIETYTNSTENVFQDGNGNLVIQRHTRLTATTPPRACRPVPRRVDEHHRPAAGNTA